MTPRRAAAAASALALTLAAGCATPTASADSDAIARAQQRAARDAARAMVAAMDAGRPGRRYVVGGHATTTRELAELVRAESGGAEPRVIGGDVTRWWSRLGGARGAIEERTWGAWRRAQASYDGSRARGELGHKPRGMEGTLRETLAWYEAYGA